MTCPISAIVDYVGGNPTSVKHSPIGSVGQEGTSYSFISEYKGPDKEYPFPEKMYNLVILAEMHTHPQEVLADLPASSTVFQRTTWVRTAGTSDRDSDFAKDNQIPVYAIAKYKTVGADGSNTEGNIFKVAPDGTKSTFNLNF